MTIGQRIALKRKERSLSQEALGQEVGVSRQSIYKWESDAAVPEIDKLIALSRLFGVSVGWLLGVEEPPEADGTGEAASPSSAPEELTEAQLKMVEQIVERYTAALRPVKRRRWPFVLALIVLAVVLLNLFQSLDTLRLQQESMFSDISRVESSVNRQIGSISSQVEDILKAQNSLVADYGAQVDSADLAKNQVTFSVRAVPKTYTDGMSVEFTADTGSGDPARATGSRGADGAFSAALTCPLTDDITVSAVLIGPDGTRSTQLLEHFDGLYSASLPEIQVHGSEQLLWLEPDANGQFTLPSITLWAQPDSSASAVNAAVGQAKAVSMQMGLFLNHALLTWLEPCDAPEGQTNADARYFRLSEGTTLTMAEETDQLVFAAVTTDEYGRQAIFSDVPCILSGGNLDWPSIADLSDHNVANWSF